MNDNSRDMYNKLFFWFEDNVFKNEGVWKRNLNLVLEFSDWLEEADEETIKSIINIEDVKQAKAEMQKGIDTWLLQNHKNLF